MIRRHCSKHEITAAAALFLLFVWLPGIHAGWGLPEINIPDEPPLQPTVITAGGQRLLLNYLRDDIAVSYDEASAGIDINRKGWWIINYPLASIGGMEGRSDDEICQILFGRNRGQIRNWYFYTAGTPSAEPPAPTGPAPIDLTPNPDVVVSPGQSIANAVNNASPGDVIHVQPGTYTGRVKFNTSGAEGKPIRIEGIRGATGEMPVISASDTVVAVNGIFVHFRGFEIRGSGQYLFRPQVIVEQGEGVLVEGCLLSGTDETALYITNKAHHTVNHAPCTVRGNWFAAPKRIGMKGHTVANPYVFNESQQNTTVNGRLPYIMEYNHVTGCQGKSSQWSGLQESGAIKTFHNTASVFRYNTAVDNNSLAFWLDWGHFNNRVEGNYARNCEVLGIGVEASPGPNLVCNNVVIDQKGLGMVPDKPEWGDYFKGSILSWDCNRTWAVHNTVDGGDSGAIGINLRGCIKARNMPWEPFAKYSEVAVNNVIVRADTAIHHADNADDVYEANYCDAGPGAEEIDMTDAFVGRDAHDLRLRPGHQLNNLAVSDEYTAYVKHDFYGLLRFEEDGKAVGAFRTWRTDLSGSVVEVEYADGTIKRINSGTSVIEVARVQACAALGTARIHTRPGGIVSITTYTSAPIKLRLLSLRGHTVDAPIRQVSGGYELRCRGLSSGVYLLEISSGGTRTAHRLSLH